MSRAGNLAPLIEPVARILLGEPNAPRLSSALAASPGPVSVDRHRGIYHDHEANAGGGVLDLIMAKTGLAKREAFGWLGQQGFDVADVGNDLAEHRCGTSPKIVARYSYVDEKGTLLFQVERADPKAFRQRRPDPASRGGWVWDLKSARRAFTASQR